MESPRILTRGTDPTRGAGRVTDPSAGDSADGADTEEVTGALEGGTVSGSPVGCPRCVFNPVRARASAAAAATATAKTRFCAGRTTGNFPLGRSLFLRPLSSPAGCRGVPSAPWDEEGDATRRSGHWVWVPATINQAPSANRTGLWPPAGSRFVAGPMVGL